MEKIKFFLINQSNKKNPWSLTENEVLEFCLLVEESLFRITPHTKGIIINSAKTISYLAKKGRFQKEFIIIEFTNYLLGSIFKQKPEFYLPIRDSISEKLTERIEYNIKSIDPIIEIKYFPNQKVELEFITDKSICDKAS